MPNYILLPVKLKKEGRASLDGESIDLSSKLSVTCGGNMNYYKSNQHPCNFQNKSVSSPFNWVCRYILLLAKLKEKGKPFLEGARSGVTLWDYPQEHLVTIRDENVSPFVKFEIILSLLWLLLDPLTNKHCRTCSSMINLWIDSRTCQKWRILLSGR